MARRGRPPKAGTVYYLGRLRYRPGVDPPELQDILQAIEEAGPARRRDILRAALLGGADEAQARADSPEDDEVTGMMDDLLGGF